MHPPRRDIDARPRPKRLSPAAAAAAPAAACPPLIPRTRGLFDMVIRICNRQLTTQNQMRRECRVRVRRVVRVAVSCARGASAVRCDALRCVVMTKRKTGLGTEESESQGEEAGIGNSDAPAVGPGEDVGEAPGADEGLGIGARGGCGGGLAHRRSWSSFSLLPGLAGEAGTKGLWRWSSGSTTSVW